MLCRSRIPWANDGLKNETIQCAGRVVRCMFVFCALLTLKVSNAAKRKNRCGAHSTGLCYSQIERVCSIAGRQVTLRSLTAFPFIASRQGNDGGFHPPSQRVEKVRLRRPFPSFMLFSNRTEPCDSRPSGHASLPDSFSFYRFATRERWGISSPKPLAWGPVPRPLLRFALIAGFDLRIV